MDITAYGAASSMINNMSDSLTPFVGWRYTAQPEAADSTTHLHLSFVYDTNGLNLSATDTYRFEFEYYTESANLKNVGYKLFLNNTAEPGTIVGGYVGASNKATRAVFRGAVQYYSGIWDPTKLYDKTYRYIKPVISFEFNKKLLDTVFIRNPRLFVGNVEIPFRAIGNLLTAKYDLATVSTLPISAGTKHTVFDITSNPSTATDPIYMEHLYDTNSLGLKTGDPIEVTFSYYTDDFNIAKIGSDLWFSNTSVVGGITGGTSTKDRDNIAVKGSPATYRKVFPHNATYRYIHALMVATLSTGQWSDISIKDFTVKANGVELKPVDRGLILQKTTSNMLPSKTWVKDIITGASLTGYLSSMKLNTAMRWAGATANFLGDSITQGFGATIPYHQHVRDLLGLKEVRNYGISSTRIASQADDTGTSMSVRYTGMSNDADLIVVFGGTNDWGHGSALIGTNADRDTTTFYGALHTLAAGLTNKYPGKQVVFIAPLQRNFTANGTGGTESKTNGKQLTLLAYVDIIKEVCAIYSIPVLDLHRTGGIYADNATIRAMWMPDGLHPNDEGHKYLGKKIAAYLNSI